MTASHIIMDTAVTDFLSTTASLYQHVAEAQEGQQLSDQSNTATAQLGIAQFTSQFEGLVENLSLAAKFTGTPTPHQNLAKSCWKISQDLLIRLRQLQHAEGQQIEPAIDATAVTFQSLFPEHDLENLSVRLYELKERWNSEGLGS